MARLGKLEADTSATARQPGLMCLKPTKYTVSGVIARYRQRAGGNGEHIGMVTEHSGEAQIQVCWARMGGKGAKSGC